ncbi:hypothetical protein EMPS_06959 [Entomortierella parvispora]|uniref:C2 domain-containing protein n=1 Tax=Entomortierella parvispora TaxID=205924 RepID=A0A9P3HD70_9FUNG|nr:hypothetical protein EMPS_06959 [Entomortierella parvispora]
MQAAFPPLQAMLPPPTSKVELKIRCKNLSNRDATSLSDPQVFLFTEDRYTGKWSKEPHGMTELIKDSLNPVFVNGLQIDYRFESVQRLKFVVYDIDKHSGKWSDQDYLGEAITDLGSIIGAKGGQISLHLGHTKYTSRSFGHIIVRAEEVSTSKRVLNFSIRANDLTKKGMFKTAPSTFFVIQRANGDGTFTPVYKSEVVHQHDDPSWKQFSVKESIICNGDPSRPLKIEVVSYKSTGTHVILGTTAVFTAAQLSQQRFPHVMPIPPMTGSSVLTVQGFHVTEPPSFLDFLAGGGTIGLTVAIDFTQSNGDPRQPNSLHYRSPHGENDYSRAIRSVGNILQCYDSDKKFPVYGYGGRLGVPPTVRHCFPLNGNPVNPEVYGVDGILQAYWHALTFAELYGPTNFAPVIEEATNIAKQMEAYVGGYSILLIITDGAITDMKETVNAIRKASKHPLSIIIVGVGHARFTSMDILDGDDSCDIKKGRDIVQFVAARDYLPHNEYGFAQAILAEVPDQFMAFMTQNGIKPRPPIRIETAVPLPMIAMPVDTAAPGIISVPVAIPSPHGSPLPQHFALLGAVSPAHAPPHLAPYRPPSRPGSPSAGHYPPPAGPLPSGAAMPDPSKHGAYPPPNATAPPGASTPVYPPQPYYPAQPPQQGYPGYSPQQYPGYPAQQPGYPPQPYGYPPPQPGYPPRHNDYLGYPPQQPGYPPQQSGYPLQQPGYPPQQPGYPPQQPEHPPQQPGCPPQQTEYPAPQAPPPTSLPQPGSDIGTTHPVPPLSQPRSEGSATHTNPPVAPPASIPGDQKVSAAPTDALVASVGAMAITPAPRAPTAPQAAGGEGSRA